MIYDIRYLRVQSEHGWRLELQVKRTASDDWHNVREEFETLGRALPTTDESRSLS